MIYQSNKVVDAGIQIEQLTNKQEDLFFIRNEISSLLMDVNDYIITKKEKYKVDFDSRKLVLAQRFDRINPDLYSAIEKNMIIDIKKILTNLIETGENIFEKVDKHEFTYAAEMMEELDYYYGSALFNKLDNLLLALSDEIKILKSTADAVRNEMFSRLIFSILAVLFITIIIGFLTVRFISKPIKKLSMFALKVKDGSYNGELDVKSRDEIKILADTLISMSRSIESKENLLKEDMHFLERIVSTIPSGLLVIRKEQSNAGDYASFGTNKVILANKMFYQMFEKTKENIIGKEIKDVLSEINLSDFCKNILKEDNISEDIQCQCSLPSKGVMTLNLRLAGFELGEKNILIVMHDITALKKAEEIIKQEKEKAQLYLDIAEVIMLVLDRNGNVSLINSKGLRVLGYSKEEIIGKNWFLNFITDEQKHQIHTVFDSLINNNSSAPDYFENDIITKSGELRVVAWHNVILRDTSGNITGTLSSGIDITEKRRAEELLKKYNEELKSAIAQKDKFFSVLSHDLRSPFNGLLGYANILAEESESLTKDEIKEFSKAVFLISQKMFEHLNNLLEWSRLQRDKIDFNPERLDLTEVLEGVVTLLKPNADKKKIKLIVNSTPDIFIKADKFMLNSIIQNLLSNAIKFTPKGGTVKIETSVIGSKVEISVIDTGVGLTPEDIHKVFRIDTTFSTKGTENEQGTGLGLIICKEMIERHSGEIAVSSAPGKGTEIKFSVALDK